MTGQVLTNFSVISTNGPSSVFFCNTHRYGTKRYSIPGKRVDAVFKRDYQPVAITDTDRDKFTFGQKIMGSSKGKPFVFQPPPVKHLPDIQKLFWVGKKLWVFTSTVEKENGVLVDVFDGNGNYAGKFYLLIPHVDARFLFRTPLDIDRDRLIIRDVGDDENFIVTVYRLPDNQ